MTVLTTFVHIFIDICLAIGNPDPVDLRVLGGWPDPSGRLQPAVRLPIPFRSLPRYRLFGWRRGTGGADQILLVDQTQDRHRRPVSARIGLGRKRGAKGQDRMEKESLLSFLRTSDRAQSRHWLLAMGVGRKRRVLDKQVSSGFPQLIRDQSAMSTLDRVGSGFRSVEEIIG